VETLIREKAKVDVKSGNGRTALYYACQNRYEKVVCTLQLAGATVENSTLPPGMFGVPLLARRMFKVVKQNMSVAVVHICGKQTAGKSVVTHWIADILFNHITNMFSVVDSSHVIDLTRGRTRGIETRCIRSEGGKKVLYLYDYGGQAEFQINHASHLASANSAYVIVVPWWNFGKFGASREPERPQPHSDEEMEAPMALVAVYLLHHKKEATAAAKTTTSKEIIRTKNTARADHDCDQCLPEVDESYT
jgi:hypothetical protein